MTNIKDKHFKDALSSVLTGYSVTPFGNKRVFVKHFGVTDSIETEYQYDLAFNRAKERGIPTNELKLSILKDQGLWTDSDIERLAKLTSETALLKKRRSTMPIPSQIKIVSVKIDENEQEINTLSFKRFQLIGTTAETIASKRAEDYYIYHSLFSDNKLQNSFFKESFEDIDSDLLEDSKQIYYQSLKCILGKNIKKIALLSDFINLMHLAQDPYQILGKPYCQYTYFQIDLISLGRFYKMILSREPKPSDHLLKDPEKLEEWWETSQNAQKILDKRGKESVGDETSVMFGATSEDLRTVFGDGANIKNIDTEIKKEAAKSGGVLDMKQMMALQGIKT